MGQCNRQVWETASVEIMPTFQIVRLILLSILLTLIKLRKLLKDFIASPQTEYVRGDLFMKSKVITILSTKGGVGKSTFARYFSFTAAELGKKVCIIDTCQNSSIATGFLKNRDSFEHSAYDWLTGEAKPSEVIQRFEDSNIYYIPSDERIDDFGDWVTKKVPRVKQLQ